MQLISTSGAQGKGLRGTSGRSELWKWTAQDLLTPQQRARNGRRIERERSSELEQSIHYAKTRDRAPLTTHFLKQDDDGGASGGIRYRLKMGWSELNRRNW